MTLEDIGEGDNALLCVTEQIGCCRSPYTGYLGPAIGNWFFPNGTGVPNYNIMWKFYRNRSKMMLHMHRRRGGENGIYHCEIPDTAGVYQIIYIGVYTAGAGEWYKIYLVCFSFLGPNYWMSIVLQIEKCSEWTARQVSLVLDTSIMADCY